MHGLHFAASSEPLWISGTKVICTLCLTPSLTFLFYRWPTHQSAVCCSVTYTGQSFYSPNPNSTSNQRLLGVGGFHEDPVCFLLLCLHFPGSQATAGGAAVCTADPQCLPWKNPDSCACQPRCSAIHTLTGHTQCFHILFN